MPLTTIPIIARTNTIDEWRIQTNKSATDLNDLGFYDYEKVDGTLTLSGDASLIITSTGTPLQVTNDVLFQNNLTLANNFLLGVQGSATGNIVAGGTISVRGPGRAFTVANNALFSKNIEIVNSIYTSNVYTNNAIHVENTLMVNGVAEITGTGTVLTISDGEASINLVTAETVSSANVTTPNLYAAFARIDVLDDLAFARIGVLENTTANSYYLSSNTHTSNSIFTRYITANVSGNIVTFKSDTSNINSATVLVGTVNVLTSNIATINVSTTNTATVISGNVVTLQSNVASINIATIANSTTSNAFVTNGNVISLLVGATTTNTLYSNTETVSGTLTSQHMLIANTIQVSNIEVDTINVEYVNVSSNLWVQAGAGLTVHATTPQTETVTIGGVITLENVVVDSNLVVHGTFTQLGDMALEVDQFTLNSNTPLNKDALIVNQRVIGSNAVLKWDETNLQWLVSKGNTYSSMYGILDASFLNSTVTSNSTANVATPAAVKAVYEDVGRAGNYANSAYIHANAAFSWANSNAAAEHANSEIIASYANSAYLHANAAYGSQNTTGVFANGAYQFANSAGSYANGAFTAANTADQKAVSAGSYANGAFTFANTVNQRSGAASSYANSAYETANTGVVDAGVADGKAVTADQKAVSAGVYANSAYGTANSASSYANGAFTTANSASTTAGNALPKAGGTITGSLTVNGNLDTANVKFNGGTALLQGSNFILNGNQNQNQAPSLDASIVVDRGTGSNTAIRWNETLDKWQYSHDGTSYYALGSDSVTANNIAGGSANQIPYQTASSTTAFIPAPTTSGHVLTFSTTSGLGWASPATTSLSSLDAGNLTSGTVSSARLSGLYSINISGFSSYATTAGSASTAGSATLAQNSTNVTSGGTIVTGAATESTSTYSIYNYGRSKFDQRVLIASDGATTAKNDPNATAALKVLGDIAVGGDVWATYFRGTATKALYADLAENYLPDAEYPVGTVLMIGGEQEVTAAVLTKPNSVIGAVSENPAFLMNDGLENGVPVALKGRIPVRVIGKCEKGDLLGLSELPGVLRQTSINNLPLRFIALESKDNLKEGLIEVAVM